MLRSLMTAVTGVRAHQTMLDVTGNNIANANTMGFKKDFTLFSDLMYQTSKSASGPNGSIGGINPAQVGLGVQVAAIETIHTQGGASYTGNQSDMMIQGTGFFVYDNGSGNQLYSRSGATARDANNDLVQSGTGYYIQGYAMERDPLNPGQFNRAADLSNVNIPLGKKLEPKATQVIKYQCNLDSRSNAYLPYGFPDLPYNSVCGWPGNPSGTAKIELSGRTYDFSFLTNIDPSAPATISPATPLTVSANGDNYLTIRIGQGADDASPALIQFDMIGIRSDGTPKLTLDTALVGAVEGYPGKSIYTLPGTTTKVEAVYDDDTGIFKLKTVASDTETGGSTIFQYNMKAAMNYASFKSRAITNPANPAEIQTPAINFIAEFSEGSLQDQSDMSDLSKTEATLTLWYQSYTADAAGKVTYDDPPTMKKMEAIVHFNPDGTFDFVSPLEGDVPTGWIPYDFTKSEDENKAAGANVRLGVGSSGSSLVFQTGVITSGTDAEGNAVSTTIWNTTGQINQGGFHQTKQTIYDCNGNDYTLEVNFKKITENRWRWEAFLLDKDGKQVTTATCEDGTTSSASFSDLIPQPHVGEIAFCGCGPICDPLTQDITIPFSLAGMPNSTITLNFGGDGDKLFGVTQYASETTTKAVYQDGYPMGVMEDYSIATDGTITGIYSNGQNIPLYRVAIATFANQQGLDKVGDTMFRATVNSGNANIDPAGMNGKGSIMAQNLEMSNVDLTEEFTHLIVAQRGFQANTRVITTSDQILEEVVNLKR